MGVFLVRRSFHFGERQDMQSLLRRSEHEFLLRVCATLHFIALKSLREYNFDDVVNCLASRDYVCYQSNVRNYWNYTGIGNALFRMVNQNSVMLLWTGSAPTVRRAMLVTAA